MQDLERERLEHLVTVVTTTTDESEYVTTRAPRRRTVRDEGRFAPCPTSGAEDLGLVSTEPA